MWKAILGAWLRRERGLLPAQVLCIQGFLACRSHADRVMLLVEMMANSGCPCFKAGARAVRCLAPPSSQPCLVDCRCVRCGWSHVSALPSTVQDVWSRLVKAQGPCLMRCRRDTLKAFCAGSCL